MISEKLEIINFITKLPKNSEAILAIAINQ